MAFYYYEGRAENIITLYISPTEITINASTRITKTYYSAGAQMVAMRVVTSTGGNTLYYVHSDHLGSTSLMTCGSGCGTAGTLIAGSRQSYFPYGSVRTAASSLPTDITFTGQRKDASTGLMFYNARYYDPVVGRFVSADTIVPNASNPQSFNRFSYVRNNPLRYTDPTGHREECGDGPCPSRPAKTNPYGVRFTADEGQSWDAAGVRAALGAAGAVGRHVAPILALENRLASKLGDVASQHFSSADAFRHVFKGGLTFHKSSEAGNHLFTDPTYGGRKVIGYSSNRLRAGSAAHEMGHAFAQRLGGLPYNFLGSAAGEIAYPDGGHIAGGGGARTFEGMVRSRIENPAEVSSPGVNPTNEDFADMFAHWTFGWFTNDELGAGRARQTWMDVHMAMWVR